MGLGMIDFIKLDKLSESQIAKLQFEVFRNYELFGQFTIRESYEGTAHGDTKSIPLRLGKSLVETMSLEDLTPYNMMDEMEFEDWDNFEKFPLMRATIDHVMSAHHLTELGWVTITSLKPDGKVLPHKDEGEYCKNFHRFHVVIYGSCKFYFEDDEEVFNQGDIFTFANKSNHCAWNLSTSHERIHLIFDAR